MLRQRLRFALAMRALRLSVYERAFIAHRSIFIQQSCILGVCESLLIRRAQPSR
jgi:hypothetical protein